MAIIQISKIQQRSGNLVDLPQLDEAQFGFATDRSRLFIGGKATSGNAENIEVLTSYSNISFSQIDGSAGGNFNISSPVNGQTLTYVALTKTWENWTGNTSQLSGDKLQLGSASNITIGGGAIGYVLETDGSGNLSWTTKGSIRASIVALSNATPIVMQVANTTPLTNGAAVTISGAIAANANTIVNGQSFYVKVANDFATTGNVSLYNAANLAPGNAVAGTNLGTYTANSGIMVSSLGSTGSSNAGGSVNTIQFNDGGILNGSANFTITGGNVVSLTGNLSASNIAGGNLVTANFFTGTLTTAAQPNITSTGTLASLSVTGNANVGNLNTAGNVIASQVTANSNGTGNNFKVGDDAYIGDINITNTMVVKGQQDGTKGYIIFGNSDTTSTLGRSGTGALTYLGAFSATGNANVGNIGTAGLITATGNITGGNVIGTLLTGTLTTAAQPNITSTGTLASLSVTANANIGNIGTGGLITATGNLNAGNIITAGIVSATGNGTFGNVSATTFTGTLSGAATTAGTVTTAAQPNITSLGTLTSLSVSGNANIGNIGTAGLITATGNLNAGNLVTAGIVSATGNGTFGNISTAGTVSATGNANVGNLGTTGVYATTLSASANANVGNLGTGGLITATGNLNAGNIITAGIMSSTGNATHGNIITGGVVTATGNVTTSAQLVSSVVTGTAPLVVSSTTTVANLAAATATSATTAGTVTTAAQPNITSTGTLASLSVTANANVGNLGTAGLITATGNLNAGNIITAGIVSATGNITANFFIGNGSQLTGITVAAGSSIVNGNSNVTVTANSNVTISAVGTSNVVVITNTGANIAGTLSVSGTISSGNILLANASIISANNMQLTTGANTNAGNITGNWTLTTGSRLQASYADLAEYYEADAHYEPGTVLAFGGEKEVTIAEDGTTKVAGIVSTNPAYAMNSGCPGIAVAIALQGRVPTKVRGTVRKGDMMVSAGNGFARPWNNPQMGTVIGKALENFDGVEGVIEVAVGRL